ncbi:Mechanosensitive ion channel protein MscL [Mycoplasma marinum]|uniref:Mechanosensitive ion channel protein MscL n=1 Tax=Mycoplasma marinum TaxID=1937190 RepID=A0A4V2NI77_9MOLU|nr:MscL family protein [Mycoplasma marinum]TCG11368.1 mechanosensitive ion channel protein MscL [Mycoplasma marinum]
MFKKSWKDAKKVVSRGNMFMLAIGMLLGAAFGAVVKSLANDIIMGAIAKGLGLDGVMYMSIGTTKYAKTTGLPLNGIMYGKFLSALLAFVIISIFILAGLMIVYSIINYRNRNKPAPAPAGPTVDEQILAELKILNAKSTTLKAKETKLEEEKDKKEEKKTAKKTVAKKTNSKKPAAKKSSAKK